MEERRTPGMMRRMIETRYPNRWFGSNPQAITNQGKKLTAFDREVPTDWRSALGVGDRETAPDPTEATE
jgi:hypothetical protein